MSPRFIYWCDLRTTITYGLGFEAEKELEEFWEHFYEIRDILRKGKKFEGQHLVAKRRHSTFKFLRIPSKFNQESSMVKEEKVPGDFDDLQTVVSHDSIRKFMSSDDDLDNTIDIVDDGIQQNDLIEIRTSPSTMQSSLTTTNSTPEDQEINDTLVLNNQSVHGND